MHIQFGLGFDPTRNMDTVIQSPAPAASSKLEAVDLASLSLEPALKTTNSHIFAFESGATWGAGGGTGSNDWVLPAASKGFPSDAQHGTVTPATFLSLSSGSTWGLGGTSIGGPSLSGDHTGSGGD